MEGAHILSHSQSCQILGNIHDFDVASNSVEYDKLPAYLPQHKQSFWQRVQPRIDRCLVHRAESVFQQVKEAMQSLLCERLESAVAGL